jgi:ammonia channel protein AmtB
MVIFELTGLILFFIHYITSGIKALTTNTHFKLYLTAFLPVVGITASCDDEPFCTIFIGVIADLLMWLIFFKLTVDDPIDAVSVHMETSTWGVISFGIFGLNTGFSYGKVCAVRFWILMDGFSFILYYIILTIINNKIIRSVWYFN